MKPIKVILITLAIICLIIITKEITLRVSKPEIIIEESENKDIILSYDEVMKQMFEADPNLI